MKKKRKSEQFCNIGKLSIEQNILGLDERCFKGNVRPKLFFIDSIVSEDVDVNTDVRLVIGTSILIKCFFLLVEICHFFFLPIHLETNETMSRSRIEFLL